MEYTVKPIVFVCLWLLFPALTCAETYRWVNEQGVVTYSQSPPPGIQAERINVHTGNSAPDQSAQERLDRLRQKMADSAEDRELKRKEQKTAKEQRAIRQQNCQAARANLQRLEGLGHRLYNSKRLTEEERQSLMAEAREQIKTNCGD